MSGPAASCSVWVGKDIVYVKVGGRANFTCSVDFRAVVHRLSDQGHRRFVLDLTDCLSMDSTFLGVLAGFGQRIASGPAPGSTGCIELLNANGRILDLLENLGVNQFFRNVSGGVPATDALEPLPHAAEEASRREVSRLCLEAHETLMALNPENVAKFKDVARFLAEDLKRMDKPNH